MCIRPLQKNLFKWKKWLEIVSDVSIVRYPWPPRHKCSGNRLIQWYEQPKCIERKDFPMCRNSGECIGVYLYRKLQMNESCFMVNDHDHTIYRPEEMTNRHRKYAEFVSTRQTSLWFSVKCAPRQTFR